MMRKPWEIYFIEIAQKVAERSTCPKLSVGAVVVDSMNRIKSTGYNGAPPKKPHCIDVGCNEINNKCQRATHAEDNALGQVEAYGHKDLTIYTTHLPCINCAIRIVGHDISQVYFLHDYPKDREHVFEYLAENNVVLEPIFGT